MDSDNSMNSDTDVIINAYITNVNNDKMLLLGLTTGLAISPGPYTI